MLNIHRLKTQLPQVVAALARRGITFDADQFESLECERKGLQLEAEALQARRNVLAAEIGRAKKAGADVTELMAEASQIPARLAEKNQQFADVYAKLEAMLLKTPNTPHESVPAGQDEHANVEVHRFGTLEARGFSVQDHADLAERLAGAGSVVKGLDFEQGAKLAGSRFSVMAGAVARLHRALSQFMLDTHTADHGYTEVYVPYMVNSASMRGTGQLPKFAEDLFAVPRAQGEMGQENFYLIPTAEVPVTNLVRDVILADEELPLKLVAHTPCFRSEAGAAGRDTRGLIRQHQFDKV